MERAASAWLSTSTDRTRSVTKKIESRNINQTGLEDFDWSRMNRMTLRKLQDLLD
jgi:hypothetical protein